MIIKILSGDVTALQADTIVNAANVSLLGGGGIDGAIHRTAGPEFLGECRILHECKTGGTKITKGYRLPCSCIVHTPGPTWQGGNHGEYELLESCCRSYVRLTRECHTASTAFLVISTGIYRFSLEQAARIAIRTILEERGTCMEIVYLVCFNEITRQIYKAVRGGYDI